MARRIVVCLRLHPMLRALLAITLLTGCNIVSGNGASSVTGEVTDCISPNTGPLPDGCGKIEGGDIGSATGIVSDTPITITGWIPKDGEPGEYIGFTYTPTTAPGQITIK